MSTFLRGRSIGSCFRACATFLLGLICLGAAVSPATADPTRRYTTDDHGNFVIIGNTVGHDCRGPAPVVGDPGLLCGGILTVDPDSGIDGYWRSDFPVNGQAAADNLLTPIGPSFARSNAVLSLPAGATVTYARLYWSALRSSGGDTALLEHPASLRSLNVRAQGADFKTIATGGLLYVQGTTDVTAFVRSIGSGTYRMSGFTSESLRNLLGVLITSDITYGAWHMVVFYKLDTDLIRNLTLFDGFDLVQGRTLSTQLTGFLVPNAGAEGRLGIVAYEGDASLTGDLVRLNGMTLSSTHNPADNFFNSTRTSLGNLISTRGDLPQLTGAPGSMSGIDMDIVDVTSIVLAGAKTANFETTSTTDEVLLGSLVTSFVSTTPVLSGSNKTYAVYTPGNVLRTDGRVLPGDTVEYTITVGNNGSDAATNVIVRDALPQQVTFTPGSLTFVSGPIAAGTKTDIVDTDQAEYVMNSRTVVFRIGTGATGTVGGRMLVGESTTVRFRVTVNTGVTGLVSNQAQITAQGEAKGAASDPTTWNTGNGTTPGAPTVFQISTCGSNAECPVTAPICDMTATPPQCVCRMNSDCPGGLVCNSTTKTCTQCGPGNTMNCSSATVGSVCLANGTCGCNANADCNGRTCDTTAKTCPAVNTDLVVTLARTPPGSSLPPGTAVNYTVTVKNTGAVDIVGATLSDNFQRPPGTTGGEMWSCMATGGAQCPAASGTGPLPQFINLPANGQLQYTVQSTVPTVQMSATVDYTVTVTPPRGYADTNPVDNVASDSILIVPGGPDLVVTVTETKSDTDPQITYTINVHNNGPGTADGATVTYQIPPGSTLDSVMAGAGWQCTQTESRVTCTRTAPIGPNMDAEPIVLKVTPPQGADTIPVEVVVAGTDPAGNPVGDPDPSNNTVKRDTEVQKFRLSGGGLAIGCSIGGEASRSASLASAAMFGALLGALAVLRHRSRSRRPEHTA